MKVARIALVMMMAAGLSACGASKAPFETLPTEGNGAPAQVISSSGSPALSLEEAALDVATAAAMSAEMHRANITPVAMPSLSAKPAVVGPDVESPMATPARYTPMSIASYEIRIPEQLTVSEANLYFPVADIVWRGDAHGNRKQQVASFFQNSLEKLRGEKSKGRPVEVEITLSRFHSLTEKTRYTIGGVHSIAFYVTLRDADTGVILVKDRKVKADLEGLGGRRALLAERQGLGMRVRIQHHLDRVIAAELSRPGGWKNGGRGLTRAIDQI